MRLAEEPVRFSTIATVLTQESKSTERPGDEVTRTTLPGKFKRARHLCPNDIVVMMYISMRRPLEKSETFERGVTPQRRERCCLLGKAHSILPLATSMFDASVGQKVSNAVDDRQLCRVARRQLTGRKFGRLEVASDELELDGHEQGFTRRRVLHGAFGRLRQPGSKNGSAVRRGAVRKRDSSDHGPCIEPLVGRSHCGTPFQVW
jgi:hypothetical protein